MESGRSPIWGGATMGLVIGLIWAMAADSVTLGEGVIKGIVFGALSGVAAALLGALSDRLRG